MTCQTCDIIRGLLLAQGVSESIVEASMPVVATVEEQVKQKAKRKASAYSKRYGKAFKKVATKYQKKSGGWMKNGFKRAQSEAHKIARRNK